MPRPPLRASTLFPWLALACLGLAAHTAVAGNTSVYRCGQTYQQTPCPAARSVDVDDGRDAGQVRDSRAAARQERQLAKDLAAERREREKALKPQTQAAGVPVSPGAAPAAAGTKAEDPCAKARGSSRKKGHKALRCAGDSTLYQAPAAAADAAAAKAAR